MGGMGGMGGLGDARQRLPCAGPGDAVHLEAVVTLEQPQGVLRVLAEESIDAGGAHMVACLGEAGLEVADGVADAVSFYSGGVLRLPAPLSPP